MRCRGDDQFSLKDAKSLARGGLTAATQRTVVVWDGGYVRLEGLNIKAGTRLMLGRSNADADLARGHGRIYLFLAFDLFLLSLFSCLPRLGFLQPIGGRRRKQDQEQGNGAKKGDRHYAQITNMGAENLPFLLGFVAGRGLHQGVLSRQPGEAKDKLG
jgi:hypothetical protein